MDTGYKTMTMDDSFKVQVERLLKCPNCTETVTDPRTLDCGHIYCNACLPILAVVDGLTKCTVCDEGTTLNGDTARRNVLAGELVELLNKFSPDTTQEIKDDFEGALPPPPPMANGVHVEEDEESIHENGEEIQQTAQDPTDAHTAPENTEHTEHTENTEHTDEVIENADPQPMTAADPPPPVENKTVADVDVHSNPDTDIVPLPTNKDGEGDSQSGSDNADPEVQVVENGTLKVSDKPETPEPLKQNGDVKAYDEIDRGMTDSEQKSVGVSLSIDSQTKCGECGSKNCTCNMSNSLLTPPVSTGSIHSEEQNDSRTPSEIDTSEIPIRLQSQWVVKESASNIELINKNKVVITRWTYDDHGLVQAYDASGNKVKYTSGGHDNYSGIAYSDKNHLFVINTNKDRIEEYDPKGKKLKHISVENYSDPHAVDVKSSGEVLVVDRDRNLVKIIGKDRKKKPKFVRDSLMLEPCDIACCEDGFYVSCALTRCILKFNMEGGRVWSYNTDPDEAKRNKLKEPQGICVDSKGDLYVVDKGRRCVLVFDPKGQLKGRLQEKLSVASKEPWYISVRDESIAILYDHNVVKIYTFL